MILEIPDELREEFVSFLEISLCNLESAALSKKRGEVFTDNEEKLLDLIGDYVDQCNSAIR